MRFVTPGEWGAEPPRSETFLDPSRVTRIFLHHTTGEQQDDVHAWLRSVQRFHQSSRGWADIGYSALVDRDGVPYIGRGFGLVGAHTKGHNATGVAVAYLGDGRAPVPEAALAGIRWVMEQADLWFGRPLERLCHRDVGRTTCPGDVLAAWLRAGMPVSRPIPPPDPRPAPLHDDDPLRSPIPDLREGWRRHLSLRRLRHRQPYDDSWRRLFR